jgi:hypothetical protein
MPFDTAQTDFAAPFAAPALTDLLHALDAAEAPTAEQALANPQAALAFLFLSPRPCAALDALLAA